MIDLQNERAELDYKLREAKDVESELSIAEDALYENHERETEVSEESRAERVRIHSFSPSRRTTKST